MKGFNNLSVFPHPQSMTLTSYAFYGMIMQR